MRTAAQCRPVGSCNRRARAVQAQRRIRASAFASGRSRDRSAARQAPGRPWQSPETSSSLLGVLDGHAKNYSGARLDLIRERFWKNSEKQQTGNQQREGNLAPGRSISNGCQIISKWPMQKVANCPNNIDRLNE